MCASEGGTCYCDSGNVYYGGVDNGKLNLNKGWSAMKAQAGGETKCTN
jgi:hypothetical protein